MSPLEEAIHEIDKTTVEIDWDPRSQLTHSQVQMILEGAIGHVEFDLIDSNFDHILDLQDYERERIADEYDIPVEALREYHPAISANLKRIAGNTPGYITMQTDIELVPGHKPPDILVEWFGKRTQTLIKEVYYASVLVFLFRTQDVLPEVLSGKTPKTIKAGTHAILHNYYLGASGLPVPLAKDVEVDAAWRLHVDRDRMGVQSTCMLSDYVWRGRAAWRSWLVEAGEGGFTDD